MHLVGLCIGVLSVYGKNEDAVIITQPFVVDLDNVNTNHYGGAYTILGLRVMGGTNTVATGYASSAGGEGAMATHDNVFVWSDGTLFGSTLPYQFSAFASNGFQLLGGPIMGDGSGLSNLNVVASLLSNSITSDKLVAGVITASHLAPNSVSSAAIASGAVTSTKLAANSVSSAAIASGAVTSTKLAANSVGNSALASGAVTSAKLTNGAVTSAKLGANSVGSTAIASGAVTSSKLAANSVNTGTIVSNAVTSTKIQDGTIVDVDIAANAAISLSKVAGLSELTNAVSEHTSSVSNPHKVKAAQVGALSLQGGVIRADIEVPLHVFDSTGNGRIGLTDSETGFYGQGIGSESLMDPFQNPALGYLYRWVNTGGGPWKLYDEGNFKAGTHYLPPGAIAVHDADALAHEQLFAGKTDYSIATNIAQSVLLASGVQTNHTGDITVNGILSANSFMGDGSGLTNLSLSATLGTGSVTTEKILDGAVTGGKIASGEINSEHLADGTVTVAKMSMDASLNMNMNRVVNLGNPVNDGDAVSKTYLRSVLSALPPQGDLSMGSFTNGAPTSFPLVF